MNKTKIIGSIGPASKDYDVLKELILNGMDVARINLGHADLPFCDEVIDSIHKINEELGTQVAVMLDLVGPTVRMGEFQNGQVTLKADDIVSISNRDILGTSKKFSTNYPNLVKDVKCNTILKLNDGRVTLKVVEKEMNALVCKVLDGGTIMDHQSVNVPGVSLNIPFLGKRDREVIRYAHQKQVDFLSLSFVRNSEDVLEVNDLLIELGDDHIGIVSKIENEQALDEIDDIIKVSDAVMVARGDLGVEVPVVNLPMYQKNMVEKCRHAGKICIVATEMLETMKKNARPTRAEVSDIANAVLDGTDAVMLSGETTAGKYPVDAVRYMANICENTEKYLDYGKTPDTNGKNDVPSTIARSIKEATNDLDIKVIIAATQSGYTARKISNLRPQTVIMAACPNEKVAKSLAINFGVYPEVMSLADSTDELIIHCKEHAMKKFGLQKKDYVLISGGFPNEMATKKTNFMKIEEI